MKPSLLRRAADADVCLLLEGTFPYVRGGVSSWVDLMIRSYPDTRFAIAFIGSREEDYRGAAYALPDNVVHFEAHYLYEAAPAGTKTAREIPGDADAFAKSADLHDAWRNRHGADPAALMADMVHLIGDDGPLNEAQFLSSRAAWDFIVDQYHRHCTDPSFTDYFWTVRIMHKPLWQLARIAAQLPPARVYHTVSTGYAGFLGTLLHYRSGRPLLVSEHGIYTKERKIDLLQSQWIRDNRDWQGRRADRPCRADQGHQEFYPRDFHRVAHDAGYRRLDRRSGGGGPGLCAGVPCACTKPWPCATREISRLSAHRCDPAASRRTRADVDQ
jgi:hypothetical protein